ncbi:flavodoxin family protein [Clostridium sp. 19966]|uniref:flavodoxin family protein n=1 Tax=Clostridium sp. 19966 TaxID=2768166 RepID=UPI0028DE56F9|nr:flavodoxin family protein [Clostridium sp. 19966]MDT8719731.1 flavodoxin family protein [Clostridium sp. 19966]
MKKRVIGILGSPRRNGKVAETLYSILENCKLKGYSTSIINLYDYNIKFCNGCMLCRRKGHCVIDDDLNDIAKKIVSSDVVILGAPTYWANVPAIVKNLFDRMVSYTMEDVKGRFPRPLCSQNQGYVLITACNTPFPFSFLCKQSQGAISAMNEFFKTSGMKKKGVITITNTWGKKCVSKAVFNKAKKISDRL